MKATKLGQAMAKGLHYSIQYDVLHVGRDVARKADEEWDFERAADIRELRAAKINAYTQAMEDAGVIDNTERRTLMRMCDQLMEGN